MRADMSTPSTSRYRLDAYVGTYTSTRDKSNAVTIWLDHDTLCIEEWRSTHKTYLIARHPFACTGWPEDLFAVGRVIADPHKHRSAADAGSMISFSISDDEKPSITGLRWKMNAESCHAAFTKDDYSRLLALPNELLEIIIEYALWTAKMPGDMHLFEEKNIFCFAKTEAMPSGGERKRFEGDIHQLPLPFNSLRRTCRDLRSMSRGLEIKLNHIRCNGWTFDSLLRGGRNLGYALDHVRRVTLFGDFTLGDNPDENLLHGLVKFGQTHPQAFVRVHVHALRPAGPNNLSIDGFMTLGYCIREAIRGIPSPPWGHRRADRLRNWLRGKQPGQLNAPNVRFFPHRAAGTNDPNWYQPDMLRDLAKRRMDQNMFVQGHGGVERFILFVKEWYKVGI